MISLYTEHTGTNNNGPQHFLNEWKIQEFYDKVSRLISPIYPELSILFIMNNDLDNTNICDLKLKRISTVINILLNFIENSLQIDIKNVRKNIIINYFNLITQDKYCRICLEKNIKLRTRTLFLLEILIRMDKILVLPSVWYKRIVKKRYLYNKWIMLY